MAASPFFVAPLTGTQIFQNADGTTAKDVVTFGGLGGRGFSLSFASDDPTNATTMVVSVFDGTNTRFLREVVVPLNSGVGAVAPVEFFTAANMPALGTVAALQDGWPFGPNYRIRVNAKAAVAATRTVTVTFSGGNG